LLRLLSDARILEQWTRTNDLLERIALSLEGPKLPDPDAPEEVVIDDYGPESDKTESDDLDHNAKFEELL
jgi:hypothetical protein